MVRTRRVVRTLHTEEEAPWVPTPDQLRGHDEDAVEQDPGLMEAIETQMAEDEEVYDTEI